MRVDMRVDMRVHHPPGPCDAAALASIVLSGISYVGTFDDADNELSDVDIVVTDGVVAAVGKGAAQGASHGAPQGAEIIDARGWLALPGLVNAHQHLYQVGLRALPELERALIGPWLAGVGGHCLQRWQEGHFGVETVHALAAAGMVESLLCGVTAVADQHYFFPGGTTIPYIEATIEAAQQVGIRLNAGRGTITLSRRDGGAAPDETAQSVDEVLRHSHALIDAHHDPAPGAQIRIDLAPCGVHVDKPELFRAFAELAGEHPGVGLHTHLYEVVDSAFAQDRYGRSPWEVLVDCAWARPGTWLAHMNDAPLTEIPDYAASGVGIAHLIAPDLRMGWGLAPLRAYLDGGCKVGFGTTGSASNDGANLLGDLRLAALAHRSAHDDPQLWPSARELLAMATRGSADIIGRPEIGRIAVGAVADIACWDLRTVDRVGIHDPLAGLLLTGLSDRATLVMVGGKVVVRDGHCTTVDELTVASTARRLIRQPYVDN